MIKVGVECGQRWWRPRSWYHRRYFIRRFADGSGFAIGPIMFWKD